MTEFSRPSTLQRIDLAVTLNYARNSQWGHNMTVRSLEPRHLAQGRLEGRTSEGASMHRGHLLSGWRYLRQAQKRRTSKLEALENRALLTTFYVDNNLLLTADRDHSGGLSDGDQVTFGNGQGYQQAGLTYDAAPVGGDVGTAFSSISQALASPLVQAGDAIDIAGGTYTESGLTIDKSLTIQGLGSVSIAAPQGTSQTGFSVIDQPGMVELKNLTLPNFQTSLSDTGGGTLELVDLNLIDGETSISNVNNLQVVSDLTTAQNVSIEQESLIVLDGATSHSPNTSQLPDQLSVRGVGPSGMFLTFSGVQSVSFASPAGSHDTISVSPLPDATITIDGDNSTPPGAPGDTLNMPTNFDIGSSLTATRDATGLSGTWTPTTGQPVHFAHIASLLPGIATETVAPITGTEGSDTGSQVVAQFTSPANDRLAAGDTASIYWGDNSSSVGTITYNAGTGVYSVTGSHTYSEGGSYTVNVQLSTPNGTVILPDATATITPTTVPHLTPGQSIPLTATVGQPVFQDLVSFTDSEHLLPGDYSAEINWGDGSSSAGQIGFNNLLWSFTVFGNHAYAQTGTDQITVTVVRNGTTAGTLTATAVVNPAQSVIAHPVQPINATEGVDTGGVMVAQFTDPAGNFQVSNYSADINWGDGTTSAGTINLFDGTQSLYSVSGDHTYAEAGSDTITVTIHRTGAQDTTTTATANISEPQLSGSGVTLRATEGYAIGTTTSGASSPTAVVATFTDPDATPDNDGIYVMIEWGDGSSSSGTVTPVAGADAEWAVSGSHTYAEDGSYAITVLIGGESLFPIVSVNSKANVVEANTIFYTFVESNPSVPPVTGQQFSPLANVPLFTFDHGNNSEPASDFAISIDWGDGTASVGSVILAGAHYATSGSHTYNDAGLFKITERISDDGMTSTVATQALIQPGGTGDQQFVANVYNDFLQRTVEAAGLTYWSARLDAGLSRTQFVAAIEASAEYRQNEVTSLFERYLHRAAEPAALNAGSQLLADGGNVEQLAEIIASSDEYFALHGGTNDGFLSALFQDALQRPIDPATLALFEQDLAAGATRLQIAEIVFSSHEYHADVVQNAYTQLLGRTTDAAGAAYWAGLLDNGLTDEQLFAAIAASNEYFAKTA